VHLRQIGRRQGGQQFNRWRVQGQNRK
jgi:hypothetical protein